MSRGIYISIFISDFAPEFIGSLKSQRGGFDSLNVMSVSHTRRICEVGVCTGLGRFCVSAHCVLEVSQRARRQ